MDLPRLAGVFGRFCFVRGYSAEGDTWLTRALAAPGGDRPTIGRAKCLFALSTLALTRGDYASETSARPWFCGDALASPLRRAGRCSYWGSWRADGGLTRPPAAT